MATPIPANLGFLEHWGWLMLSKPTLHITYRGSRIEEFVKVSYYDPDSPPRSNFAESCRPFEVPVPVPLLKCHATGRGKYIRAWVHNLIGFPARGCRVFLESALLNGNEIEGERSPLHWMDTDAAFELPMIRRGYRNGAYIDICASDSVGNRFQIISQGWRKGRHRYDGSGIYQLELTAESENPCSLGHLTLSVQYEKGSWESLKVVHFREGRKLLRWT